MMPVTALRKYRVLIVEDSPAMRQLLRMAVQRDGRAEVIEAQDGLEALRTLTEGRFDLMVADINMPVLDGLSLLTRIREEGLQPAMKIAMVTTETSAETEAEARARGAHFYLRKPVNRRDIERMLAAAFK